MKQRINFLLLLFFMFSFPALGAENTYSLLLNNIAYETTHPVISSNDHVYLSLDDLSDLFLVPVTFENGTYRFTFNSQNVRLTSLSRAFVIDGKSYTFEHLPLLINNEVYIPVELLSHLDIVMRIDYLDRILSVSMPTPYSRNSDDLSKHTFREVDNNLSFIPKHITALSSEDYFETALDSALENGDYITFINNEDFRYVSNVLTEKLETTSYDAILLTIRELDTSVYPNVITGTKTLPVTVVPSKDSFALTIGADELIVNQLWAAYHPATSFTAIDLEKSIDSTLMKAFYTYYRNFYDLRDDLYFEPFEVIKNERTQTIEKQVYTENLFNQQTNYALSIYRTHPTGNIHYIIDLKKEGN